MQCLYQTLDLLPSATDSEIRSAYRRCALSTHPDKGGSAEAFRSVVTAFETLIDRSQRAAYDQLRSRPTSSTEPGGLGSVRKDLPKRPAEAAKSVRPPKVKRPTPAKDAKDAPKKPTPPRRKAPPAAAEMEMEGGPMDHAVEELQKLTEETLNAFAGFLQSEEVEEILRESLMLPILALQDRPKTQKCAAVSAKSMKKSNETKMQKMPKPPKAPRAAKAPKQKRFESNPARVAQTVLKGVTKKRKSYRPSISLFRGFLAAGQYVSSLDVAIDMHICLVQMRQHIAAGLAEGRDLKEVVHGAINAAQTERAAAGAVNLRLRFQTYFRHKFTPIVHDLDTAIQDWLRKRDLKQLLGGGERARLKALYKQKQAEKRARVQHGRLCATVQLLQTGFQKTRRHKLLKAWGVPELPEGLQLSSFQSDDDSLCVTLRLSDGTEVACPKWQKYMPTKIHHFEWRQYVPPCPLLTPRIWTPIIIDSVIRGLPRPAKYHHYRIC